MIEVVIIAATLAVLVFQNLSILKRYPDQDTIPMQFGFDAEPTWSAKRNIFVGIIPFIGIMTLVPILALFHFGPEIPQMVGILTLLFVCVVLVLCNILHHFLLKGYFSR